MDKHRTWLKKGYFTAWRPAKSRGRIRKFMKRRKRPCAGERRADGRAGLQSPEYRSGRAHGWRGIPAESAEPCARGAAAFQLSPRLRASRNVRAPKFASSL